jgi:CHASE1-domain containing sensor protein/nitrogen-specific signal transduction histidine kinase
MAGMKLFRKQLIANYREMFGNWHDTRLAWIVLATSAFISIIAWKVSSEAIWANAELRFNAQVVDIEKAISIRLHDQQVALKGGVGLFNASDDVSRDDWRAYYQSLDADKDLPGLQGFGYAEFFSLQDLPTHVARIRSEGFSSFEVRPPGPRKNYAAIAYLEPFDRRNQRAFGYDMWSERTRREAMQRAIDTGEASLSGVVTLVQEDGVDFQRGFLMYVPLYKNWMPVSTVNERRKAIKGFVYSPFRVNDLMRGILGNANHAINFRIYDGTEVDAQKLLYDSAEKSGKSTEVASLTASREVLIHGHPWLVEFAATSNFMSVSEQSQPYAVGLGALIIDVLLFMTLMTISGQRSRLNQLVARRTNELNAAKEKAERAALKEFEMRKRAQKASQRLQDTNRELTRFASIVAHDLRAPLKRIECFVDIFNEDYAHELSPEAFEITQRINTNAGRMRSMLDSLHEYTRVGNTKINKEKISLSDVVSDALTTFREIGCTEEFKNNVPEDLMVLGDQNLIENVLQNLIGNSIKFRGTEPLVVRIDGRRIGNGNIELTVEDNGIGIEPKYAQKVFEMFTRLHDEDEIEGTGIGLAVCRKIIRDHDGEIIVCPNKSGGTLISIVFPDPDAKVFQSAA